MKQRLFVAIDFPKKIKDQIYNAIKHFNKRTPEIRWEKKENLHLTLKFLGYCQKDEVKKIHQSLYNIVVKTQSFLFEFDDFGYFLHPYNLIFWLGIRPTQSLMRLQQKVNTSLVSVGFKSEKRRFHPHVTLARIKKPEPVKFWKEKAMEMLKQKISIDAFIVDKIVLMQSTLTREGSIYTKVEDFQLNNRAGK